MARSRRPAIAMLAALLATTVSWSAQAAEPTLTSEPAPRPPSPGGLFIVGGVLLQAGGTALFVWGVGESFSGSAQGVGQIVTCLFGCDPDALPPIDRPSPLAEPMMVVGLVSGMVGFGMMVYGIVRAAVDASAPPPSPVTVTAGPGSVGLTVAF